MEGGNKKRRRVEKAQGGGASSARSPTTLAGGNASAAGSAENDNPFTTIHCKHGKRVIVDSRELFEKATKHEGEPPRALFRLLGVGEGFAKRDSSHVDFSDYDISAGDMQSIVDFIRTGVFPALAPEACVPFAQAFNALGGWDHLDIKLLERRALQDALQDANNALQDTNKRNPQSPEEDVYDCFEWRTVRLGNICEPGFSRTCSLICGSYTYARKRRDGPEGDYDMKHLRAVTTKRAVEDTINQLN